MSSGAIVQHQRRLFGYIVCCNNSEKVPTRKEFCHMWAANICIRLKPEDFLCFAPKPGEKSKYRDFFSVKTQKVLRMPQQFGSNIIISLLEQPCFAQTHGIASMVFTDIFAQFICSSNEPREIYLSPWNVLAKLMIAFKNLDGILGCFLWIELYLTLNCETTSCKEVFAQTAHNSGFMER